MARTNPTDLVISDSTRKLDDEESARRTTAPFPTVAWQEHAWPASGWFGDQHWAALFRHSIDRFHRLVSEYQLVHVRVGHVVFVEAQYLLQQLGRLDLEAPEPAPPPPPPAKPKRKKPHDAQTPNQAQTPRES